MHVLLEELKFIQLIKHVGWIDIYKNIRYAIIIQIQPYWDLVKLNCVLNIFILSLSFYVEHAEFPALTWAGNI